MLIWSPDVSGNSGRSFAQKRMPGFAYANIADMRALGIRFGKGLQLVNILRDREAGLRRGRTYVQAERLDEVLADARGHLQAATAICPTR